MLNPFFKEIFAVETSTQLPVILLLLSFSVLSVILFRRLHLPPVLGYLLVGSLIGPHAYNLIGSVDKVTHPAEYGIVFLMFSIGLEFSLAKLHSMRKIVFGLGLLQVIVTISIMAGVVIFAGLSWQAGIALGGALSMSSTAVLVKLLAERQELDSSHGRETIGVLLFQDLAVVPLLILIPAFSKSPEEMAVLLGISLLKAAAVLAIVLYFGQKLLRAWFHIVAKSKSNELFVLNVLLITLSLGYLTQLAGLSMALGAFLAGMLIAETEYRHQVEEDIKPFRDVLMGLFFITIGMLLDVDLILDNFLLVLAILCVLLALKFIVVGGLSRYFGSDTSTAFRSALWLCAGSEFGFVLLAEIRKDALMPAPILQTFLAALVLSMLLAPFIVHYSDRLVLRFVKNEWMARAMQMTQIVSHSISMENHVLICGFGQSGQYLARLLTEDNVPYQALDLDPDRVSAAVSAGENVMYGNATKREILIAAGLTRAKVLVISFLERKSAEQIMTLVRETAPYLPIIVRTSEAHEIDALYQQGATEVVPEVQESALVLASHALIHIGVPIKQVLRRIRKTRLEHYRGLRGFFQGESDIDDFEAHDAYLHSVPLTGDAFAIGKTLKELDLTQFSIEINAVRRRGILASEPANEMLLEENDVLVLLGLSENISLAEQRLLKG